MESTLFYCWQAPLARAPLESPKLYVDDGYPSGS